jgi:hypothetical protein
MGCKRVESVGYASAHASNISVDSGGHLVIASEGLKQNLLQQIDASKAMKETVMNDRAKAVKTQHGLQDAMGVKHSE